MSQCRSPGRVPRSELVFLALGSNLGDRSANLAAARSRITALPNCEVVAESAIEETEPIGGVPQGYFLNQMLAVRTSLSPRELLSQCLEIETLGGRRRVDRWGPRSIDIDIGVFGDREVREPDLQIPHPEISNREFWKREMTELSGALHTDDE